jgi:hypothetical protein
MGTCVRAVKRFDVTFERERSINGLCETPDGVEDYEPTHCPNCLGAFGADAERELMN